MSATEQEYRQAIEDYREVIEASARIIDMHISPPRYDAGSVAFILADAPTVTIRLRKDQKNGWTIRHICGARS